MLYIRINWLSISWLLSAFFLAISWFHPWLSWGVIVGAALFWLAVQAANTYKKIFWQSFFIGMVMSVSVMRWVLHTKLVDLEIASIHLLLFGFLLAVSVSWGLALGLVGIVSKQLMDRLPNTFYWFLPVVWLAGEIVFALLFSISSLGPGSELGLYYSFGYIGYQLLNTPFFDGLAMFGGVYALSLLAASLSAVLYLVLSNYRSDRWRRLAWFSAVIFLAGWLYQVSNPLAYEPAGLKVIAIDTAFNSRWADETYDNAEKADLLKEAVITALQEKPDLVILPEDSRLVSGFASREALLDWLIANQLQEVLLIDSARTQNLSGGVILRAFIFSTEEKQVYAIDKQRLVPTGEYWPYAVSAAFKLSLGSGIKDVLANTANYRPGPLSGYDNMPEKIPGILFCFESVDPFGVWKLSQARELPFVVHLVSHSWFLETDSLQRELDLMLKAQSLWSGKAVVTAANMSQSQLYLPDGSIETASPFAVGENWQLYKYEL